MLAVVATLATSCASLGSGNATKTTAADLYSVMPKQDDVRKLMGDTTWWSSPPSFEVDPLDAATRPPTEKFAVSQLMVHIGTDEYLAARYAVFDKTSSATGFMSDLQLVYGTPAATSPKVGDQVLYYSANGSGAAPYATRTFVRVGQIALALIWAKKDTAITLNQLTRNAKAFADPLRNLGKAHPKPSPVDPTLLPPPDFYITLLGAAILPTDSLVVMVNTGQPDLVLNQLHILGITDFTYGDYALDLDTHMEVQTALIKFPTHTIAAQVAEGLAINPPDSDGISSGYLKKSGSPASGEYRYSFAAGPYAVLMICRSSIEGEAASRECENPMDNIAFGWKLRLEKAG